MSVNSTASISSSLAATRDLSEIPVDRTTNFDFLPTPTTSSFSVSESITSIATNSESITSISTSSESLSTTFQSSSTTIESATGTATTTRTSRTRFRPTTTMFTSSFSTSASIPTPTIATTTSLTLAPAFINPLSKVISTPTGLITNSKIEATESNQQLINLTVLIPALIGGLVVLLISYMIWVGLRKENNQSSKNVYTPKAATPVPFLTRYPVKSLYKELDDKEVNGPRALPLIEHGNNQQPFLPANAYIEDDGESLLPFDQFLMPPVKENDLKKDEISWRVSYPKLDIASQRASVANPVEFNTIFIPIQKNSSKRNLRLSRLSNLSLQNTAQDSDNKHEILAFNLPVAGPPVARESFIATDSTLEFRKSPGVIAAFKQAGFEERSKHLSEIYNESFDDAASIATTNSQDEKQ